jgi:hypothetical protein
MRTLLILLNSVLLAAIVGVWFFWHPEPEELPLPGTYAEKLGRDVPDLPATTEFEIVDAYAPAMPPGTRIGAAYLRMRNGSSQDVVLVAASSPAADSVELHNHSNDGGVMRMRRVQEMVVPAAQVLALEPGGQHLMLIDLKQPLAAGATLTLTLSFADGSARTVLAAVR